MGVDLIGHGGASFNGTVWRKCFEIAIAFGWQPAGTVAPPDYDGEWNGTYFSNDLQEVSDTDARAWGTALHQAVISLRTGQALTEEQAKACDGINLEEVCGLGLTLQRAGQALTEEQVKALDRVNIAQVCKFADYAVSGRFAIA